MKKLSIKKDVILFGDKISFQSITSNQREEILELLSRNKYLEAMNLTKQMIKSNIEFLKENTQEIPKEKSNKKKDGTKEPQKEEIEKHNTSTNLKPLINFGEISIDDLYKYTIEKIISTYLYYQEYFSNILLVIHLYIKLNYLEKVYRVLNFLKNEMESIKFCEINQMIIKFMVQNENNIETKNSRKNKSISKKLYDKCEEIYFNALKIYICGAQYAINIRELNLFQRFLIEFVLKISLLFTKDNYIIYNTFLLVGNLYLKVGYLQKAHFFYEKILKKTQHGIPKDYKICKVIIAANYNLGLICYITGKYETAKLRLETALEIKKIMLKNNYDLELINIYETLAEVDIQYKNYTSAFLYIQEGTKLLNNKFGQYQDNNIHNITQRTNQRQSLMNIVEKSEENDFQDSSSEFHQIQPDNKEAQDEPKKNNQNYSTEEIILSKKFKILNDYIGSKLSETLLFTKYDNLDEQKNSENGNLGNIFNYIQMRNSNINKRKERADDAEDNILFKEFLESEDNEQINDPREINQRELSTFILFITSLTEKQLKKLNSDQPKDYEYNKKYPIVFTKEFKDSLSGSQRYNFCQLRLSSLTRIRVLSDYNKKISSKNMNYKGLYKIKNANEIDKINLYVGGKSILSGWEHEHDPEKEEMEFSDTDKETKWKKEDAHKNEDEFNDKIGKKDDNKKISYSFDQNEKYGFNNMMKLSKEIFVEGEDYINFDRFKKFVLDFFKDNLKEDLHYVNDEFLILITKDLNKNKIKKILFNPKLLYELLVTYYKSKGIEIEKPKRKLKAKGDKNENIIVLNAA